MMVLAKIFMSIKHANDAVRKGNAYRLNKYGPAETVSENYERIRAEIEARSGRQEVSTSSTFYQDVDNFKSKYYYWDEWTGGRFARRINPAVGTPEGRDIEVNTVCRSNPTTGQWELL